MQDVEKNAKLAFTQQAVQILEPYKVRFEHKLEYEFLRFGPHNQVKQAMQYSLKGQGKRFRPALVYMVADALGSNIEVTPSALAVEYFHTSSLIADDLPCMDKDDYRRGVPTTHKVFGEATTILASYALIAAGFEQIAANAEHLEHASFCQNPSEISRIAVLEASRQMGNMGLIGGQCLDLTPTGLEREDILTIMQMKTVSLFDLSFTLGWLFGGGSQEKLPLVHQLASHFGIAFQVLDDLDDREKDKEAKRLVNYALRFGEDEAAACVQEHVERFFACAGELQLHSPSLMGLAEGLALLSKTKES